MTTLSHTSVMGQVQKNKIFGLIQAIESQETVPEETERFKRELYEMLMNEPTPLSEETFRMALGYSEPKIGFVRGIRPIFDTHNPKPKLTGYDFNSLRVYLKLVFRYMALRFLIKFLPRILRFETDMRTFVVIDNFAKKQETTH